MANSIRSLALVLGSIAISGCQGDGQAVEPKAAAASAMIGLMVEMGRPEGVEPAPPAVEGRHMMDAGWKVHEIMTDSRGWGEADERVQALIEATPSVVRYQVEQLAAVSILRTHLLEGNPIPDRQRAIARYVDLLVQNRSPEATVIADAIEAMPSMDAASRARWAAAASQAAEATLARRYDCDGCGVDEVLDRAGMGAQRDHALASTARSITRLQTLARGS
jgi:hypothetical protein